MWKFIVDVVYDFVSSLQPDVGRGFLHVANVFLLYFVLVWFHPEFYWIVCYCVLLCVICNHIHQFCLAGPVSMPRNNAGTDRIDHYRDHSGYGLSQWEETLQCNAFSQWLSPYPEWALQYQIATKHKPVNYMHISLDAMYIFDNVIFCYILMFKKNRRLNSVSIRFMEIV